MKFYVILIKAQQTQQERGISPSPPIESLVLLELRSPWFLVENNVENEEILQGIQRSKKRDKHQSYFDIIVNQNKNKLYFNLTCDLSHNRPVYSIKNWIWL